MFAKLPVTKSTYFLMMVTAKEVNHASQIQDGIGVFSVGVVVYIQLLNANGGIEAGVMVALLNIKQAFKPF